jgi:hypothetical protein
MGSDWIEQNSQEKLPKGAVLAAPIPWTLRVELQLLRAEAEELLKIGKKE